MTEEKKMKLEIKSMDEEIARQILSWRYDSPYNFYNNENTPEQIRDLLENDYSAIVDRNGELVGFFCVGSSAQVPVGVKFGAYNEDLVDIGLGMAPVLIGQRNGFNFFAFILETIKEIYGSAPLRLTVATFNQRAIRLYEKFGFVKGIMFTTDSAEFVTMRKGAEK